MQLMTFAEGEPQIKPPPMFKSLGKRIPDKEVKQCHTSCRKISGECTARRRYDDLLIEAFVEFTEYLRCKWKKV